MPIVTFDAMRQAYFRDAGADYGDIVYWSKPSDASFQFTTLNASTYYVYIHFNTTDGPVVLDVPAATRAGLLGFLNDPWQTPLVDIGPDGADEGNGGRYLLLPPNYPDEAPADFIPVRPPTYNTYVLFRLIPASSSAADLTAALALVRQMRVYPLAHEANPREQRYIDMAGRVIDGLVAYDDTFFDALARVINEEPVQIRDLAAMGQLHWLGIEKGTEFNPDAGTRGVLRNVAGTAHAQLWQSYRDNSRRYWPDVKSWVLFIRTAVSTNFTWQLADRLDIDERAAVTHMAFNFPKKLGQGTFYVGGLFDATGAQLQGESRYRLRVPADVPAKQYWSTTVYDATTAGFIRAAPRVTLDSYDRAVNKNADGSIDVYFGPQPPRGKGANWIPTAPGRTWFTYFRFYQPGPALFDKTWKLPEIEPMI
jgi:hypothetical protein